MEKQETQERPKALSKTQERCFVFNASVSLLWFLRDEPPDLCQRADWLYDDIVTGRVVVHVPDLWLYEVSGRKASFWMADRRLYEFLRRTRRGLKVAFRWVGDYLPSQQN